MTCTLVNYFLQNSQNVAAEPWQQLDQSVNQFRISQNVDSLKQMENDFPNDKATNFALQIAGDYELNRGLQQLPTDREGAMTLIKRAKETFQKVYDAPNTTKTVMQQRRSLFTLAYAAESLGEFDEAKAPGAAVEDAPDIGFPVIDIPKEMEEAKESSDTGGDFEAAKPMAKPADQKVEVKEVEATEESKPAADSEMKKDQSATPTAPAGEVVTEEKVVPAVTTTEEAAEVIKVEPVVETIEPAPAAGE